MFDKLQFVAGPGEKATDVKARRRHHSLADVNDKLKFVGLVCCVMTLAVCASAQSQPQSPADAAKKTNTRSADIPSTPREPFDGMPLEKMAGQCVTLDTEAGAIIIEMIPDVAPEAVRNFLNLTATGALDTTTFGRIVKDFVI